MKVYYRRGRFAIALSVKAGAAQPISCAAPVAVQIDLRPVRPRVPASILQLHRSFTLVADEAALSKC
jgi:hypothetical protein